MDCVVPVCLCINVSLCCGCACNPTAIDHSAQLHFCTNDSVWCSARLFSKFGSLHFHHVHHFPFKIKVQHTSKSNFYFAALQQWDHLGPGILGVYAGALCAFELLCQSFGCLAFCCAKVAFHVACRCAGGWCYAVAIWWIFSVPR